MGGRCDGAGDSPRPGDGRGYGYDQANDGGYGPGVDMRSPRGRKGYGPEPGVALIDQERTAPCAQE